MKGEDFSLFCMYSFGKLKYFHRRERNKPEILGDALSCRASPLFQQSTGLLENSPLAERLKAASTCGRYGTLSHALPEALPLDSAKGTLSLWKPGFVDLRSIGECLGLKMRICSSESLFSLSPAALPVHERQASVPPVRPAR